MNHAAISVQDLRKSFGENHAVQGVSFDVEQGEIFSLLGPNGAGKITTISMLSCLLRPDDGDAYIMGHSIRTDAMGVKSVLGVVPQEIALYEDLTARENLTFWGKMYGLRGSALKSRVKEVLDVPAPMPADADEADPNRSPRANIHGWSMHKEPAMHGIAVGLH